MRIFFVTLGFIIALAFLLMLVAMTGYAFTGYSQFLPYLQILFLVFVAGVLLFIGLLIKIHHGKTFLNK